MLSPKLLIVEDDAAAVFGYMKYLSSTGYTIKSASCLNDAKTYIELEPFDGIVLDLNLPDGNSLEWIADLRTNFEHLAIIITTGNGEIATAVQAMKYGADNYLTKPLNMADLEISLQKCLEIETLRKKNLAYKQLAAKNRQDPCFCSSGIMHELLAYAKVVAADSTIVLITGETGTGKGVLAHWIHNNSMRRADEFVELNCSSLRGDILRSELFGHARGSFTSAVKDHLGLIEIADGGTLFLDEIGDMELDVQAQLLKTIEEKTYRRIGENKVRRSDFRLICATNQNLAKASANGLFRKDLLYRINVFPIYMPSLNERKEDIACLAEHILSSFGYQYTSISKDLLDTLVSYDWPGNIRELRNMLERAMLLAQGEPIEVKHFPGFAALSVEKNSGGNVWKLSELENAQIIKALHHFNFDKHKTCQELGISLSSLYRKLEKLDSNKTASI